MEQLIVTPIRPHQLIVGKLLPFVLIGLVDAIFVLAVARVLVRRSHPRQRGPPPGLCAWPSCSTRSASGSSSRPSRGPSSRPC
ncbi:MAG: ABC transporter permease [Ignavibacteriales bacterium]|nr:ABC transporter permease [Ignavibacteriales bacterium]